MRAAALFLVLSLSASAQAVKPAFIDLLDDSTPVRLPWSDVLALVKKAGVTRPGAPPFEFALGAGKATGEVSGKVLNLTVTLPLTLVVEDWVAVPLFAAPATLRRASWTASRQR